MAKKDFDQKFKVLGDSILELSDKVTEIAKIASELKKENDVIDNDFNDFINKFIELGMDRAALLEQMPHFCSNCAHFCGYDKEMNLKCDMEQEGCKWKWKGRTKIERNKKE